MCGRSDLQLVFKDVVGGKITLQHQSLIMGGFKIAGGDQSIQCQMSVAVMNRDLTKKNLFHHAWIGKVYNAAIAGQYFTQQADNDGLGVATYASPVFGDIYPIRLAQYIPFNNWIAEGTEVNVADYFAVIPSVVAVAECKRKP